TAYGPLLSVKLFLAVVLGGTAWLGGPAVGLVALLAVSRLAGGLASLFDSRADRLEPVVAAVLLVVAVVVRAARPERRRRGAGAGPPGRRAGDIGGRSRRRRDGARPRHRRGARPAVHPGQPGRRRSRRSPRRRAADDDRSGRPLAVAGRVTGRGRAPRPRG